MTSAAYDTPVLIAMGPALAARVIELEADSERLRAALKPFADIGIGSDPEYQPMIRMDRAAILAARAALNHTGEA